MSYANQLKTAAQELNHGVKNLNFSPPVAVVYNPLDYAWASYSLYLETFGNSKKEVVFLGMNPGPWGMAQTGIPFGEISAVKDWLKIESPINKPKIEHPRRPVDGFECKRSEVSGFRLWGLLKERFGTPEKFFEHHFVANYCPLVFMEESSRNRTPDKLNKKESRVLFEACDQHLREVVRVLKPQWLIGVGKFVEKRARIALKDTDVSVGSILHPSPANPAANRDWAGIVTRQLAELKIWKD